MSVISVNAELVQNSAAPPRRQPWFWKEFVSEKFVIPLKFDLTWIMISPSRQGEAAPDSGFYEKLRQHLVGITFDQRVSELCEPLYWATYFKTDPRIDPVVYFKMLMIGFLENLNSERAIAARCSDSLSVRRLLGYGPEARMPGERELRAIRDRLEPRIYEEVLDLTLRALKSHGLLDGVTISPEIIEDNANLRGLVSRNTEYVFRSYFDELTRKPPVVPSNPEVTDLAVPTSSFQSALAATREGTFDETSDDPHQARWCRRISGRGRVQLKKPRFRWW
jgi:transposase